MKQSQLNELRSRGYFTDAQATITSNNIGLPANILTSLSAQVVKNVLSYRTADEVLGQREKLVDWGDQEYILPFVEQTGVTTPYGDFAQPAIAGMNTSFNKYGHYRFSGKYLYGTLESEQYSKAKIDYQSMLLNSVTEAIAVEFNRAAFSGYIANSGNQFLCYGLLNTPNLANYQSNTTPFASMTWEEVMAFFGAAVTKLVTQTGNNINGQSEIRVPISASAFSALQVKYTTLGISVYETILKTYPRMKFIPAIELDAANSSQNVIYFIGQSELGGLPDTTKLGYSEIARMGNVVLGDNSFSQTMSAGTVGAIVYKPFMVVRYTNV